MHKLWRVLGWMAVAGLVAACAPEINYDATPDYIEFDPSSDPPRAPEPNAVVINPETGLIDFGALGVWLPTYASECGDHENVLPVAQCEFYLYLQTLDGYPTLSPARVPATAELDLTSARPHTDVDPGNLLILDRESAELVSDVAVGWNDDTGYLTIDKATGWRVGHNYVLALRGYDLGVQTVDGNRVVSSSTYFMLRQQESLVNCVPDGDSIVPVAQQVLDQHCKWFEVVLMQLHDVDATEDTLYTLEALRQSFVYAGHWDNIELFTDWPRDEVAIVWSFPVHSNSVVELQPALGLVPQVVSDQELRLPVHGPIDPASLVAFSMLGPQQPSLKGTVILLNLTALQSGNTFAGFPDFAVSLISGAIAIRTIDPMVDGELYGVILTVPSVEDPTPRNGVRSPDGRPIVPSPVTVFLRSRGPITDSDGATLISSLDDATAGELEAGRLQLVELLEDGTFTTAASITRENIAYLYAFEYPNP